MKRLWALALAGALTGVLVPVARAETAAPQASPPSGATPVVPAGQRIVLFRLESLGMPPEIVARLEALLRVELDRLLERPMPSRVEVERAIAKDADLRNCAGEVDCLLGVGKKLGTDLVIAGNVGGLGESYVVNMKLVDVASGTERNRIKVPLEGNAEQLIEAVRVALVNLVSPERVRGNLAVLVDVKGAKVIVDGTLVGTTPLKNNVISNLDARPEEKAGRRQNLHQLRIVADGYIDYIKPDIEVRFQKTTEVVVRLQERVVVGPGGPELPPIHKQRRPFYTRWWFYAAVGVGAVVAGAIIGKALSGDDPIDCMAKPEACTP
jgi:hypothetical protein